jgi:hypothetical protein
MGQMRRRHAVAVYNFRARVRSDSSNFAALNSCRSRFVHQQTIQTCWCFRASGTHIRGICSRGDELGIGISAGFDVEKGILAPSMAGVSSARALGMASGPHCGRHLWSGHGCPASLSSCEAPPAHFAK